MSEKCTIKLKRPQITKSEWKDKDGGSTSKGLVGQELTLSASCNADTEEGSGVTFKIYEEGQSPASASPVAQLGATVAGGKAEGKWTYHYKHDPENPLKEKPKYFFTVDTPRAKQAKSSTVEIGAQIKIQAIDLFEKPYAKLDYELVCEGGKTMTGQTDNEGKVEEKDLIPRQYHIRYTSGDIVFYEQKSKEKEIKIELGVTEKIVLIAAGEYIS